MKLSLFLLLFFNQILFSQIGHCGHNNKENISQNLTKTVIKLGCDRPRWESKQISTEYERATLINHSLAAAIVTEEILKNIDFAIYKDIANELIYGALVHDFCELSFGDESVGFVNKTQDEMDELTKIDKKMDIARTIKKLQDFVGENLVLDRILHTVEKYISENTIINDDIMVLRYLIKGFLYPEHPIVKYAERLETSLVLIMDTISPFIVDVIKDYKSRNFIYTVAALSKIFEEEIPNSDRSFLLGLQTAYYCRLYNVLETITNYDEKISPESSNYNERDNKVFASLKKMCYGNNIKNIKDKEEFAELMSLYDNGSLLINNSQASTLDYEKDYASFLRGVDFLDYILDIRKNMDKIDCNTKSREKFDELVKKYMISTTDNIYFDKDVIFSKKENGVFKRFAYLVSELYEYNKYTEKLLDDINSNVIHLNFFEKVYLYFHISYRKFRIFVLRKKLKKLILRTEKIKVEQDKIRLNLENKIYELDKVLEGMIQ